MGKLVNPYDALASLEAALATGELKLQRGEVDPTLGVLLDMPNKEPRLTYVRRERGRVAAVLMAVQCVPVEGERCYNLGWAVAEKFRGQGRAKEIVAAGLSEMRSGLGRNGVEAFYVEAVVGRDNLASLRVAEHAISDSPKADVDTASGEPVYQFLKRVACA